jgi:hypothetical protein
MSHWSRDNNLAKVSIHCLFKQRQTVSAALRTSSVQRQERKNQYITRRYAGHIIDYRKYITGRAINEALADL